MCYMDLRHTLLFAINMLKSQVGSSTWVWDPFNTIAHPTSTKTSIISLLFLLFPFTCIKVPIACSVDTGHIIIVRLGKFDPCLTVSLVASIVFPQALFWYTYPIIIMTSFWSSWLLYVFGCFLSWLQNVLTTIPVINIIIRATVTRWHNSEPQDEIETTEWNQQSQEAGSDDEVLDVDAIEVMVV